MVDSWVVSLRQVGIAPTTKMVISPNERHMLLLWLVIQTNRKTYVYVHVYCLYCLVLHCIVLYCIFYHFISYYIVLPYIIDRGWSVIIPDSNGNNKQPTFMRLSLGWICSSQLSIAAITSMNVPPRWTDAFLPGVLRKTRRGLATATAPIIRWGWTVPVAFGTSAVSPRSWQWSPRQNSRNLGDHGEPYFSVILMGITMVKPC